MNDLRITSILLLFIFVCNTSLCLKNDRGVPSFNGPNPSFTHHSRSRNGLSEYLVPPPRPKPHPLRSGRVTNPMEGPGYFSQFMSWLNPFNYGSSPAASLKSPHHEAPHPPPPQHHGPPPQNLHPGLQPGPSLHPPLAPQAGTPLYPPLGPPHRVYPSGQPGPSFQVPPAVPAGPPLSLPPAPSFQVPFSVPASPPLSLPPGLPLKLPPGPPLQLYNVPSTTFHDVHHDLPPSKDSRGIYLPPSRGKPCNPCNKVPWIPMPGDGLHSEQRPIPSQVSNDYLPPNSQGNHDVQVTASHEIRVPDYSEGLDQNGQHHFNSPLPNPLLYPGPIPPLYNAEAFDRPSQNQQIENLGHLEPPLLSTILPAEHKSPEVNSGHYHNDGNGDQKSIGTNNQGHISAIPQNHEFEIKELTDNIEFDGSTLNTQIPISGPSFNQGYPNNPSIIKQETVEVLNEAVQPNQNTLSSFGSSNIGNHNFANQNGNEYHESFNSNHNTDLNYLPPDLNPSASFGSSTFQNQDIEGLNHKYTDDLSPSSSIVQDSRATTQTPIVTTSAPNDGPIHFEESPLLDLTKKGESRTDVQWPTSTVAYTDIDEVSDNTMKTTTNYNVHSDNILFEDTSNFVRPTESYSPSDIQNINTAFEPSTAVDFSKTNREEHIETTTTNTQDVSYIPPSNQPGFLWPSLLLRNDSSKNLASLNHLAQWKNTFLQINDSGKQDSVDLKDANDTLQRQQNTKRNKQVQVIIPYTSEYTPIPFQQSYGDWSIKTNLERTLPRKVPSRGEVIPDNYIQQESRNDIRVVNQLQSQYNFNESDKLNVQSIRPSLNTAEDSRSGTTKGNNSIDVRRLQKNIDNWTIQEYSKPTTSSTILPSSLHPYLSPSKKIPTEYLTTTEPSDHTNESKDHNESVKTYSLAGFSFNEVEHEVSASNRIEETKAPISIVRIDSSKATANGLQSTNKSTVEEKSTWEAYSVSISPVNKERVYVVTPQSVPKSKNDFKKQKENRKEEKLQHSTSDSPIGNVNNSKNNLSEFEAIEKAYQVLPQAVNNLAVASTGKENIPLWGIMEHEEFASLNLGDNDEDGVEDIADGPVLYSGHSNMDFYDLSHSGRTLSIMEDCVKSPCNPLCQYKGAVLIYAPNSVFFF